MEVFFGKNIWIHYIGPYYLGRRCKKGKTYC